MLNPSNLQRIQTAISSLHLWPVVLIVGNMFFNIVANVAFKYSADSPNLRGLLFWQVVGNLAGLITVITLTWLLRYMPLHVAFPITTGLAVIGVQVIASWLWFGETISPGRWMGGFLVAAGIVLLSGK